MRQSVIAGVASVVTWQAVDQFGEPADPGATTVTVVSSDGSAVAAGAVVEVGAARSVALPALSVDELTLTWVGQTATATTFVDVVGGVFFSVGDLRSAELTVSDPVAFPDELIRSKREMVETLFEQSCGVQFVRRFRRYGAGVALPAAAEVLWTDADGVRGCVVGLVAPPADVKSAAMLATRHYLTSRSSLVDLRVMALSNPDGSRSSLATPGLSLWVTGIPEVDEVLKRYRYRSPGRTIHSKWSGL